MNEGTPSDAAVPGADSPKPLGEVIAINDGLIKDHLDRVVVKTVEETLTRGETTISLDQRSRLTNAR